MEVGSLTSLYIHWPFCPYRCHFCPFVALAGHEEFMDQYHEALTKEIKDYALEFDNKIDLETIYFGGGTPSTYPEKLLLDMFGILNSRFGLSSKTEITLEVNPGTVTLDKLRLWKRVGINRLSIGVQSLNTSVLKNLNRHQKSQDVYWLIDKATEMFDNISIDLIVGLPGVSADEWKSIVDIVSQWPIQHVSMYFLTVHEDTPLYFGVKSNKIVLPKDKTVVDSYHYAVETFEKAGLEQYEVSSFSRPNEKSNNRSKHNRVYWNREPFRGFGLGAYSFDGKCRWHNQKNLMSYLKGINQGENIKLSIDEPSSNQIWLEKLMLGLRQVKGIFLPDIIQILDDRQKDKFLNQVTNLYNLGLIVNENDFISLTPQGLPVVNEIIVKLSSIE